MKWVRLLAVGKSLVGLRDGGSRYRLSDKAGLPRFTPATNPFRVTTLPSCRAAEGQAEPREMPEGSVPSGQIEPKTADQPASGSQRGKLQRLAAKLWSARPVALSPFRERGPVSAVQTELALDRVKVMRNDLSETDFEVVPAKEVRGGAPPPSPVVAAEPARPEPKAAIEAPS